MRETELFLDAKVFKDGQETLKETCNLTEEEAERRYENVLTGVMLEAQEAGRDWERNEYKAITDVLIGIQKQQLEEIEQMKSSSIPKISQHLSTLLIITTIVQGIGIVWFLTTGSTLGIVAAGFLSIIVLFGFLC